MASALLPSPPGWLIEEKEKKLCIRFYRRADGTTLTQDCPVGLWKKARAVAHRVAGGIAAALALMLAPISCSKYAGDEWTNARKYDLELTDPAPRTGANEVLKEVETEPIQEERISFTGAFCEEE